jgi:hypothetical protein
MIESETRIAVMTSSSTPPMVTPEPPSDTPSTHCAPGVFFADMTKAQQSSNQAPTVSGTSNIAVKAQSGSYQTLVIVHAILLGAAFVIVFPLGVMALRTRWKLAFTLHYVTQSLTTTAAIVGLALAIALSIVGVEYDNFDEVHQIFGFCILGLLVLQALGGIVHHRLYKKLSRRTLVSHGHIWLGRAVIYGGMVNAIL